MQKFSSIWKNLKQAYSISYRARTTGGLEGGGVETPVQFSAHPAMIFSGPLEEGSVSTPLPPVTNT